MRRVLIMLGVALLLLTLIAVPGSAMAQAGLIPLLQVNVHNIRGENLPGAGTLKVIVYDSNYNYVTLQSKDFSEGESFYLLYFF